MGKRRQYTSAEYRKFAKQIVIITITFEALMYGYLAATGSLGEDFALMPLMAIPAAALGVVMMLASTKYVDKG